MNYLLDTNVLSEVQRPRPDEAVLAWLDQVDEDRTYLSVVSVGEIARGVPQLEDGRRKVALQRWLDTELPGRFGSRLLPVDRKTAVIWGQLMGRRQAGRAGAPGHGWLDSGLRGPKWTHPGHSQHQGFRRRRARSARSVDKSVRGKNPGEARPTGVSLELSTGRLRSP